MRKSASFFLLLSIVMFCLLGACSQAELIEIRFDEQLPPALMGEVYIDGEVNVPGLYPLKKQDTLEDLLESAGGMQRGGDGIHCRIYFESDQMTASEQKVDLNRASEWLLEALPGIGPGTAQKIVSYRSQYGPFRHVKELMNVTGIGEATYIKLSDKITVLDISE
ncbi:MAG: ComEA family DNA-binding protein [Dehalococcoidales bacterium]|jgi:competence protein ComEA|nr:ComEA family DNA-binding protein [Dehalococcoidales bacterium]MDX9986104.1 ComEA family DNA-binding protein [Dehalococcoidales bacterium]